jgi:hypothetical protein
MSEPHPDDDPDSITPEEIRQYLAWSTPTSPSQDPYLDGLRFDQKFLTENGITPQ